MTAATLWGILLPTSTLTEGWFAVLALFVALNTLAFATLSVLKLLPKWRPRSRAPRHRPAGSPSAGDARDRATGPGSQP